MIRLHPWASAPEENSCNSDCLPCAGNNASNTTPITTNTPLPIKNPVRSSNPKVDITTASAKLDHAANAIKLRCADGFRRLIKIGYTPATKNNPTNTITTFNARSRIISPLQHQDTHDINSLIHSLDAPATTSTTFNPLSHHVCPLPVSRGYVSIVPEERCRRIVASRWRQESVRALPHKF